MIPVRINAGKGDLLAVKTDKFKIELLTLCMTFPASPRKRGLCSLLFSTLKRGCVPYPDIASLSRTLDDLYDANITTMMTQIGDSISAGFFCECLARECYRGEEDLLCGTLDTLQKMLYEPLLDIKGKQVNGSLKAVLRCNSEGRQFLREQLKVKKLIG